MPDRKSTIEHLAEVSAFLPSIAKAPLPAVYSQARQALAQCWKMDECKDWSDKAAAMASYAKQSKDKGLYEVALRIQARAERRCGELLREFDPEPDHKLRKATPGLPGPRAQAAKDAGLSDRQRKTALRVANVEESDFEKSVEASPPVPVGTIAKRGTKKRPRPTFDFEGIESEDFHAATRLLGIVTRFREDGEKIDLKKALRGMKLQEKAGFCRNAQAGLLWLSKVIEAFQCMNLKT